MHGNGCACEWSRCSHCAIHRHSADKSDRDGRPDRDLHGDGEWHGTAHLPVAKERDEYRRRNFSKLHHLGDHHLG